MTVPPPAPATFAISSFPVTDCTVYRDRAELSRCVRIPVASLISGDSAFSVILNNLQSTVNSESIRVRTATAGLEILEVAYATKHNVDPVDEPQAVSEARDLCIQKEDEYDTCKQVLGRIMQRDTLLSGYMNRSMGLPPPNAKPDWNSQEDELNSSSNDDTVDSNSQAVNPPSSHIVTHILPDQARELLEFHRTASATADSEIRSARKSLKDAQRAMRVAREQMHETVNNNRELPSESREVTIVLNKSASAIKDLPSELTLMVTYTVSSASWQPMYDVRVSRQDSAKTLQLTYYGVVKQSSGEDWSDVNMSLSTATPSVGGTPPAPPTRVARYKQKRTLRMKSVKRGGGEMMARSGPVMQCQMVEQQPRDEDCGDVDNYCLDEGEGMAASARVATSGTGGSSTFKIDHKTTVESDNKEHKVCIAMIELTPTFKYFMTPSLEAKAYVQLKAVNTSLFPLLASSEASVFVDGSYVCNTALEQIFPNESFSIFLGTDETVKVEHKCLKKVETQGEEGGMLKKKRNCKQVFKYVTSLHNTKAEEDVEVTLVELLPRTQHGDMCVSMLEPAEGDVKEGGEGSLKLGSVLRNANTNNVVFSKVLKPGMKMEVPFSYEVTWPFGRDMEIV